MTAPNRISTHGSEAVGEHTCAYKKCGKSFNTASGLAMHVGRIHTKTIPTVTHQAARNGHGRGKLTKEQKLALIQFLVKNHSRFSTKSAAFTAALDHAGATGIISNNSTSVDRYFKKAAGAGKSATRKYTRRALATVLPTASSSDCVLTGPGMRIEFSAALLPTVLHTIALSLGGRKA